MTPHPILYHLKYEIVWNILMNDYMDQKSVKSYKCTRGMLIWVWVKFEEKKLMKLFSFLFPFSPLKLTSGLLWPDHLFVVLYPLDI